MSTGTHSHMLAKTIKMPRYTLLWTVIILAACNNSARQKNHLEANTNLSTAESEDTTTILTNNYPQIDYQQKDSLVYEWVEYFENYSIDRSKNKQTYEPTENKYNPQQIDTIIKTESESSLIKVYKVKQKMILDNSYVYDNSIILPENLLIGQSRKDVINILDLEFSNDTLELGDLEGNSRFKLIFEEDKLRAFIYCGYLE